MKKRMGDLLGEVVEVVFEGGGVVIEVVRRLLVMVVWMVGGVCLGIWVWEGLEWRVREWLWR